MELSFAEELVAIAIGHEVLARLDVQSITQLAQCEAVKLLEAIKRVLDDETLDDPACFQKIEAIISVFHDHGLYTSRHDFG